MLTPERLKYVGSGRNRDVYLLPGGRNVLKVPRNLAGVYDNLYEHSARYLKDAWSKTIKVNARCRLIPGTTLLVMEYLVPVYGVPLPRWTDFIDGQQVGLSKKGVLKAYDYGLG